MKDGEALLVEVSGLSDAEGPHQLIDALSLLTLAGGYPLVVDVLRYVDLVAPSHKGGAAGGGLEERRHHPGLMRPLVEPALNEDVEFVGRLGLAGARVLLIFPLKDEVEEKS